MKCYKTFFNRKRCIDVLTKLEACVISREKHMEKFVCLLTGKAGSGKTSLCGSLLQKRTQNIFYLCMPYSPTPRQLAMSLLEALGMRSEADETVANLTQKLIRHITLSGKKILLLDEFENIQSRPSGRPSSIETSELLCKIIDTTGLSICLVTKNVNEEIISQKLLNKITHEYSLS